MIGGKVRQRVYASIGFAMLSVGTICCTTAEGPLVSLSEGVDASAGGDAAFIVTTPTATYYLERSGGGLSSLVDTDGVDWLGFHKAPGSGHKGEYRGFPNAVHKQDGNFFHAMNAGTDASTSTVTIERPEHVRIVTLSGNTPASFGAWEAHYDFHPDRLDFTMVRIPVGRRYWVQYEGVPGGTVDDADFRFSSESPLRSSIREGYEGDLPGPEWMAFGDPESPRMLFMRHHTDDAHPDDYASRPDMTVFAFGRRGKDKFLTQPGTVSIGFVEATDYATVSDWVSAIPTPTGVTDE